MKKSTRKRHSRSTGLPIYNTNVDVRIKRVMLELGPVDKWEQIKREWQLLAKYFPESQVDSINQ